MYVYSTRGLPYFLDFFLDGDWYRLRANDALSGKWLSAESHFRGPLYPWFLAGVFRAFGESPHTVRVVQAVLGSANAVLVWVLARRLVSSGAALVAALLYAGYGMIVFFDGEILSLPLETALVLGSAISLLSSARGGAPCSGLLLGLASIARPSFLPIAIPAALYLRRRRSAAAAFLLAFALPILPVVLWYRAALDDWIPISAQGGINFYLGNHAGADGSASITPCTKELDLVFGEQYRDNVETCSRRVAEQILGRRLKPSEVSGYWFSRGLALLRERPAEFAHLFLKRLYLVVGNQELDNNQDVPDFLSRHARWIRAFPVSAGLIVALGLPALIRRARKESESRFILAACVLLFLGAGTFLVISRYRMPLLILALPYAGLSLVELGTLARSRAWRPAERRLVVILLILVFVSAGLHRAGSASVRAAQHVVLGYAEERAGNERAAADEYRRSLGFEPTLATARYSLGNSLVRLGEGDAARKEYEELLAQQPEYAPFVSNSIGILALESGDAAAAVAAFRRALEGDPAPTTRANLGIALIELGRADEAVEELAAAWGSGQAPAEVGVDLARARLAAGDSARATADLEALLAGEPKLVRGWLVLADARGAQGDRAAEAAALRAALRAEPDLAEARERLARLDASAR